MTVILDSKLLAKMLRMIDLLEENGPVLRKPYSEPVGDGLFELRAKHGSNITRVLYFFAKKYKADYERRYGNEQL